MSAFLHVVFCMNCIFNFFTDVRNVNAYFSEKHYHTSTILVWSLPGCVLQTAELCLFLHLKLEISSSSSKIKIVLLTTTE